MDELATALSRVAELLRGSADSDYASTGAQRLARLVEKQAARARQGRAPRKRLLRDLFTPAGDIQDHALANGWADEYLSLAAIVDRHVEK
jgi:hypothetical protein